MIKKKNQNIIKSFQYAFQGIKHSFVYEKNMSVHFLIAILILVLGFILNISIIEWLFCITFIGLVIGTELINTSIEALLDVTHPEVHPLVKVAKDTAAGAVLIFSLISAIGGLVIFIPKIIDFIK